MYIYLRFGRTVFNQVLTDLGGQIDIQKTLTLDELHIYGSSRHGIHKPEKRVVRKTYVLEEIESDGTFDYGTAQDSTIATISYKAFTRKLTYKQYELSNHLGNVLATILDRKTPQIGSDTVLYYDADVSTAGMYYAFGSAMSDLAYKHISGTDTAKYRYGFNNQEKDNELGDYYAFEYRVHDARLGRFLSIDPLSKKFPFYSVYQFASNSPIVAQDLEGLETSVQLNTSETQQYWTSDEGHQKYLANGKSNSPIIETSTSEICINNSPPQRWPLKPSPEKLEILELNDGYGNLQDQYYGIGSKGTSDGTITKEKWDNFVNTWSSNPGAINNNFYAKYTVVTTMKVGNHVKIDFNALFWPTGYNSVYVRITDIEKANDLSTFSMTFKTLEGHPDAGYITFSGERKEDGTFKVEIRNSTRGGSLPVGYSSTARATQQDQWEDVIGNIRKNLGFKKNEVFMQEYIAEYKWDSKSNKKGELVSTKSGDLDE